MRVQTDDGSDTLFAPVGAAALERFEIGGLLGRGGQAEVFRARDRVLGRDVALKVFDPASDLVTVDRVLNEMRTLAGLDHPGVVTVHDVGTADGRPYLVMRLVDRGSLAQLLAAGPLPVGQAAVLTAALCEALRYVHARGLVHRDLKPANILLATDPAGGGIVPLLADFGTASLTTAVTTTGDEILVGTPAFLAPEQVIAGADVGPAADVYALGLVVLEAVTGRREFAGPTAAAAVERLDRDPVVPPDLPAGLRALLAAMTARDPRFRPTPAQAGEAARRLVVAEGRPGGRPPVEDDPDDDPCPLVLPGAVRHPVARPPRQAWWGRAGRQAGWRQAGWRRAGWGRTGWGRAGWRRVLLGGTVALGLTAAVVATRTPTAPPAPIVTSVDATGPSTATSPVPAVGAPIIPVETPAAVPSPAVPTPEVPSPAPTPARTPTPPSVQTPPSDQPSAAGHRHRRPRSSSSG